MFFNIRAKLTVAVQDAIDTAITKLEDKLIRVMDRRFKTRDEEDSARELDQDRRFQQLARETNERLQQIQLVANRNTETTQANFQQCVARMSRLEAIAREQSNALARAYQTLSAADLAVARELKLDNDTSAVVLCELIEALATALKLEIQEGDGVSPAKFVPIGTALEEGANDQLAEAHQMIADAEATFKAVKELRGEVKLPTLAPAVKGKKASRR